MKKIIDRYLFIISTNLKLPKIQVLSRNQSSYRFIISKKEQQAKFALLTLVKEELPASKYEVEFDASLLSGSVSPKANTPLLYISINFRQVHSVKQKNDSFKVVFIYYLFQGVRNEKFIL